MNEIEKYRHHDNPRNAAFARYTRSDKPTLFLGISTSTPKAGKENILTMSFNSNVEASK